jgi:cyclopropane fatty-acyl-phospholipid synthase-like methyltransferase
MWDKKQDAEKYYDAMTKKLLMDYIKGNPRTESAISFFINQIPIESENILDIGCGIGWSSHEMAMNSEASVIGIDLSQNSIKAAKSIFKNERLSYDYLDILEEKTVFNTKFDVITLLDVFEHIPADSRETFYKKLDSLLTAKVKILITCPTIQKLTYLEKNEPQGLQPVDEHIDLNVLTDFAQYIKGDISYFEYKSIWNKYDYFHCLIERGFEWEDKFERKINPITENTHNRINRLHLSEYSNFVEDYLSNQKAIINNASFIHRIKRKIKIILNRN